MGNELFKNYSFQLEGNRTPVAVILPAEQEAVIGSIVKLDGRTSVDPERSGLTYSWSFAQIPIGSQVEKAGFTPIEDDDSVVTFAPDIIGTYKVQLTVSDGSLTSAPTTSIVDTRVILVPHHTGYVPDASFIWNYLSDFWTKVEGRKRFDVFWSAAIQIVASEMLKLYQYDYNKSIKDIQEVFQKRWLSFSPGLTLDRTKVSFVLADDLAGLNASTCVINPTLGTPIDPQPALTTIISVPTSEGNFETNSVGRPISSSRILQLEGRAYSQVRSSSVPKSVNYGEDGRTAGGSDFYGGGFSEEQVGYKLVVFSGEIEGEYLVESFVDEGHITVTDLNGDAVTLPVATEIPYSVTSIIPEHSGFFTDIEEVPAGLESQSWRLSATLVSNELNFESNGVSVGDLVEVEITRTDVHLSTVIYAQVVSVDRSRLGFVLNLTDLVEGEAAEWFTDDVLISMANDLQVVGLAMGSDGVLVASKTSAQIQTTVNSPKFKRVYFDTRLDPDTDINIGPFLIRACPIQIIRNRKFSIDSKFVSVPILQEYVKQPVIVRDGESLSLVVEGGQYPASREPYILTENLDYLIDDESTIRGVCNLTADSDEIEIPYGDLIDRSIQEQDRIVVTLYGGEYEYEIRRVLSDTKLRVYPPPMVTETGSDFVLTRRVAGKFIRFVRDIFTKKKPAPTRLWSEVSYLDNNDLVEANFGALVGVTQEQVVNVSGTVPYRSIVAGLMYALTKGPTISNLALSAQILLGLPFTQNAGVITEINPNFRVRDDGSPYMGRILVAARDKNGNSTGLTNIYLYPHGRQVADPDNPGQWLPALPDFSGIADNPDTGEPFIVGDTVAQFVPLSKGVQIQEYLSSPSWTERLTAQGNLASIIQKYHAFQVLVNSDLVTASDIDLASQFLSRAKGHYLKFTSGLLKSTEDLVEIDESLIFGRPMTLYEAPGLGLPSAMKLDDKDENSSILSLEGSFYTRYLSGEDLVTTKDSNEVASSSGGFIVARPEKTESHDEPYLKPGDLLRIYEGSNKGFYTVDSVEDDTHLIVLNDGVFQSSVTTLSCSVEVGSAVATVVLPSGVSSLADLMISVGDPVSLSFSGSSNSVLSVGVNTLTLLYAITEGGSGTITISHIQLFSIYRPLQNPIWSGTVQVTTGDGLVTTQEAVGTTPGGIFSAGVTVGDNLVFYKAGPPVIQSRKIYTVVKVVPDPVSPHIFIIPDPMEDSGPYTGWIFRDSLVVRTLVTEYGVTPGSPRFLADVVAGSQIVTFVNATSDTWLNACLIRPGDTLEYGGEVHTVLVNEPGLNRCWVSPPTETSGSSVGVDIYRTSRGDTPITLDILDRVPGDYLELSLVWSIDETMNRLKTTVGSQEVETALLLNFIDEVGVIPGDEVLILEGADSTRDVGYGAGVFPVVSIVSSTRLQLSAALSETHLAPGILYGIRRKSVSP